MKRPSIWPEWLDHIWAKSPESKDSQCGESLAQHTWNVLEKLTEAIRLRPDLPKSLGFPRLWHCLFWACFLHDFGKAAKGFQDMLRGGTKWPYRHEVLSLAFLDWVTDTLSDEEQKWIAAAIVSHHRDQRELEVRLSYLFLSELDEDPLVERIREISEEALDGLWRWLSQCTVSWIEALGLAEAGIAAVEILSQTEAIEATSRQGARRMRYWLKSYHNFVRHLNYTEQDVLIIGTLALRGYLISSDHMASAHTGPLSASPLAHPADLLVRLGLKDSGLYAHQKECVTTQGSVVLTAPTGSGKTESALLWAYAQSHNRRPIPRLFYTLPYQASMNAMYDRLQAHFPQQVGLEHSRSTLALYRRLLDQDYTPQTAARTARWAKNLAHLNYFPIRVLSPYQILKAAYRLKGYESLLSDYFGAIFVLDEVHAYETERLAMILGTVKYLVDHFGARFFVMSATLPELLQVRLEEVLGPCISIRATPELFARFCRHTLFIRDGDLLADTAMASIAQAAHDGQAAMVCCNTVKRAQAAYDELQCRLKEDGIEVILLHGRFNGRDRLEKENVVRQATGSRSKQRRPIVLVATQVVEVSLDIDLDVIYTDSAPLEALIQRFGRINRRRLMEWAPVCVFREPADGQGIYEDDLVQGALAVLERNDTQIIDEGKISDWLDEVYQGEIAQRWNAAYTQAYADFEGACLSSLRAFNSDEQLEEDFYRAFDSIEVLPACLEAEYRQLVQDEPLDASQLLVPVRWGQLCRLRAKGKVREVEPDWPKVVDADYSSKLGLTL